MDATVPQLDGDRFVYLLPFSPTRVLIEDTRYSDGAAQFHPVTGYSLLDAVLTSAMVAQHWRQGSAALTQALRADAIQRDRPFYRLLSRMLFRAADPKERWRVFKRFYRLPEPLIDRFHAGQTTPADMARILIGKSPVPIGRAIRALPERRQNA